MVLQIYADRVHLLSDLRRQSGLANLPGPDDCDGRLIRKSTEFFTGRGMILANFPSHGSFARIIDRNSQIETLQWLWMYWQRKRVLVTPSATRPMGPRLKGVGRAGWIVIRIVPSAWKPMELRTTLRDA